MRRGTTPTITVNMGTADWSNFPSVVLTLRDKRSTVLVGQDDMTFSTDEDGNHLISATLTQKQTLSFLNNSRVKLQLRSEDASGNAYASDVVILKSDEILWDEVIGKEGVTPSPTPRPIYACSVVVGTVTTIDATQDAYITNTGTDQNAILNFGIPRGKDGAKGEKGDKGDAGSLGSITASIDDTTGTPAITVTYDGTNADFAFSGLKGAKGDTGAQGEQGIQGIQGEQGLQGIQGIQGERGLQGEQGIQGIQGIQGETGKAGSDGVSPTVETEQTSTGANIIITDATGSHTATLLNGAKGDTGSTGADGVSPTVETEQTSTGATITITDATGKHTATLLNGEQGIQGIQGETGKAGSDGVSPTVATTTTATGVIITITDKDGEHTATVSNGSDYVLTDDDKTEIRDAVYDLIENADEVSY